MGSGSAGPLGAAFFLTLGLRPPAYVASEAVTAVFMHLTKTAVFGRYTAIDTKALVVGMGISCDGSWFMVRAETHPEGTRANLAITGVPYIWMLVGRKMCDHRRSRLVLGADVRMPSAVGNVLLKRAWGSLVRRLASLGPIQAWERVQSGSPCKRGQGPPS